MSPRLWIAAAIVPLTLIALYVVWWFYLASSIDRAASAWIEQQKQRGLAVVLENRETSGFPFSVRLTARNVRMEQADGPTLTMPFVAAEAGALAVDRIAVQVPEGLSVLLPSENGGSSVQVDAKAVRADLDLRLQGGLDGFQAQATDIAFAPAALPQAVVSRLSTLSLDVALDRSGAAPVAAVVLDAALLEIAPDLPAEQVVDSVKARLRLEPLPGGFRGADVNEWRTQSGQMLLEALDVTWAGATLSASGTLRLDGQLQPAGELSLRVSGEPDGITEALQKQGLLDSVGAQFLRNGLKTLAARPAATPPAEGTPATVAPTAAVPDGVMFMIRDRRLRAGGIFEVYTFPQISWP